VEIRLILRHTGEDTKPQSFTVNLGAITWGSIERTVLPVARGACIAHYQARREGDVRTGEICAVTLDMMFGNHYGSAFVLVKDLVAELQEKAAKAETAPKAKARLNRKSFMEMGG
jgi:hypothetical protein